MGEDPERKSELWKATLAFILVIWVLAVGVVVTHALIIAGVGVPQLSVLVIFLIAFLIGIGGASVYVVVQMVSDKELLVFTNLFSGTVVPKRYAITIFIVSGGLVAAMAQASTGSFDAGHIWVTFLLGFGWQGVVAGVGASSAVRSKSEELVDREREVKEGEESKEKLKNYSEEVRDRRMKQMDEYFRRQLEELRGGSGSPESAGGGA